MLKKREVEEEQKKKNKSCWCKGEARDRPLTVD